MTMKNVAGFHSFDRLDAVGEAGFCDFRRNLGTIDFQKDG